MDIRGLSISSRVICDNHSHLINKSKISRSKEFHFGDSLEFMQAEIEHTLGKIELKLVELLELVEYLEKTQKFWFLGWELLIAIFD